MRRSPDRPDDLVAVMTPDTSAHITFARKTTTTTAS
jgi:hypothetical protein